ncbi:PTS sugar transporter subunit IIA [Euzebya sp.]|uniref:PTS sugar transporter subunit IIA n=1 Tax=Euzebya sp. TaxID=1971409 RepID=UPI003515E271
MADAAPGTSSRPVGELLPRAGIKLGLASTDRADAVAQAGALLVELGAVQPAYADAMQEREAMVSSYVGEQFAIPHGTNDARALVNRPCLAFLQFPDGIDWEGQDVRACIAIAAAADEHVQVMSTLATILLDPARAEALRTTDDPEVVLALLAGDG